MTLGIARIVALTAVVAVTAGCAAPPGRTTAAPTTPAQTDGAAAVTDTLHGGRYVFRPIPAPPWLTIVATGPDRWVGYPSWAMDGPEPVKASAPSGIGLAFFTADSLNSDPCHWDPLDTGNAELSGDVPVGPTVDDLVTALRANTFYAATASTPVTISGFAGQELVLQLPAEPPYATCDKDRGDTDGHVYPFGGPPGLYAQGEANIWDLFILDIRGTRLITVILSYAGTPQADLDIARNLVSSMEITP